MHGAVATRAVAQRGRHPRLVAHLDRQGDIGGPGGEERVEPVKEGAQGSKLAPIEVPELEAAAEQLVAEDAGCAQEGIDLPIAVEQHLLVSDTLRNLQAEPEACRGAVAPALDHAAGEKFGKSPQVCGLDHQACGCGTAGSAALYR